ncbi:19778_t:CDS:2, partial [Racocetra fulgida]
MQASDCSVIEGMISDIDEQMNQLISIRGPDAYQAIDEFVELIEKFIENNTGVDINKQMTIDVTRIENLKKLKHKGRPKIPKPTPSVQDLNAGQLNEKQNIEESSKKHNEAGGENSTQRTETHHCGNCY